MGRTLLGRTQRGGSGAFSPCPLWGCLASGNAAIGASAPRVFPPGGIPRPQMLTPPHPTRVPIPRRAPTRRVTLHPQPQSAVPLPTPFLTPNPIALPHHSPPVAAPHPRRVPVSLHGALSLDTCPQPPWNSTPHRSPTPSPSLPIPPSQSPPHPTLPTRDAPDRPIRAPPRGVPLIPPPRIPYGATPPPPSTRDPHLRCGTPLQPPSRNAPRVPHQHPHTRPTNAISRGTPSTPPPTLPSTPPPRRPVPAGVPSAPGPAGDPPRPRVGSWRCHVRRSGGDLSGGGVAAPPAATVSRPKCPPGRGRKWEGGVGPTLWPRPLHRPPPPTSGPFNPFRVGGETREERPPP